MMLTRAKLMNSSRIYLRANVLLNATGTNIDAIERILFAWVN